MFILEGSDTQFRFHITEKSSCWDENDVDLTAYDNIILTVKYADWSIVEYLWNVDENETSNVVFDIYSEATIWKVWEIKADIWGVKDVQKHRFNEETIRGNVLNSLKVPEWNVVSG